MKRTQTHRRKAAHMIGCDDEVMELKTRCVPLILDCPRNITSPPCPFRAIREVQDVISRVNWLKGKSADELRALLAHHTKCMGCLGSQQERM